MRWFIVAAMLVVAACTGGENLAAAEKEIGRFHANLNAGEFTRIHEGAGPQWKQTTSKTDAESIFRAIRTKLGPYEAGKQNGWRVNYGTGGTLVVVRYESHFQKGDAIETFTFRRSGDNAQLVGYNINSKTLITG